MCISSGENTSDTIDEQCSSHSQSESSLVSMTANWHPQNINRIRLAIDTLPTADPGYCAVFDFDNTCIFRDIGQAVFRHQLFHLKYRLNAEHFAALIPELEEPLAGVPYSVFRTTLIDLYAELMEQKKTKSIKEIRDLEAYERFRTLFFWYAAMARKDERLGPRFVLPLLAKLLAGFTVEETALLTAETIREIAAEPLAAHELHADFPEPIGYVKTAYPMGMNPFEEMRQLIEELEGKGISCKVVSASTGWLVREAVRSFAFPVQEGNIFGIKVKLAEAAC